LIDRFLLRRLQTLGLLDQLFGCLRGARLQLPARDHTIVLRRAAGIAAPEGDRAYAEHNNDEGRCGDRNRLSAETHDGAGTPGGGFDHTTPNPDVILKFQNSTGRTALKPGIWREAAGYRAKPRK